MPAPKEVHDAALKAARHTGEQNWWPTAVGAAIDTAWDMARAGIDERLQKLEAWAHEPFDFTALIERLEAVEEAVLGNDEEG